jgi:hypothetical protein
MAARSTILDQVIRPKRGGFPQELARYLLSLDFTRTQHARYARLAAKAQNGTLTRLEQSEIDEFLMVDAMLTVLQSKARVSLKKHSSAA